MAREALLGTAPRPSFNLSRLFDEYESATKDEVKDLSPDQLRIWRNGRIRAVAQFVQVVGEKPVAELTHSDAIDYSEWWRARVVEDEVAAKTANKDMGQLSRMLNGLGTDEFIQVLQKSGLAARRPVGDIPRPDCMLANSNLIITARDERGQLVGVSRAITDFSYSCYLSHLALDRDHQGKGIGKRLIEDTRQAAGPESMCLLLSAPDASPFYHAIGMSQPDNAFIFKRLS